VIAPETPVTARRWGLFDILAAMALAFAGSFVMALLVSPSKPITLPQTVLLSLPMWAAYIGVPLVVTARKGSGPRAELGWSIQPLDVPIGLAFGVAGQLVLPILYRLVVNAETLDRLDDPARELADSAATTAAKLLLVIAVVLVAPIAEELFFRGLIQRAIGRRLPMVAAVVVTAAIFALMHFQNLQLAGLVVAGLIFGGLAAWRGRLGPAIVAHMAFNGIAVWQLHLF